MQKVDLDTPLPLFYVGPDLLKQKDLPCIIYLALSAKESLDTDPFNQPAVFLQNYPVRVVSVDLPFHGSEMPATEGMKRWAEEFSKGNNPLASFLDDLEKSVRILIQTLKPSKIGIMGLSRGGFLAAHLAARIPEISVLVAFAPLTRLGRSSELQNVPSPLQDLDIDLLTSKLFSKAIKAYIGNRDERVGTDLCYQWIRSLVEEAFSNKIRSPQIELSLQPSIGFQGHGTPKEVFEEGALWLARKLGLV